MTTSGYNQYLNPTDGPVDRAYEANRKRLAAQYDNQDYAAGYGVYSNDPGGLAWQQSQRARQDQDAYRRMLLDQMAGEGTSVAEQQMRDAQQANMQQQLAIARSGQGTGMQNAGAVTRAQRIGSQQGQAIASKAAILRAQEQQAARDAYARMLSGQRGQDLQALQGWQNYGVSRRGQDYQSQQAAQAQDDARNDRYLKAAGTALATGAMMMSDRNAKNVHGRVSDDDMRAFLRSLAEAGPRRWEYRDDEPVDDTERGEHVGPMTQDLDRTRVGQMMVEHGAGPRGHDAIDMKAAMSAMLASMGQLQREIDDLKGGK